MKILLIGEFSRLHNSIKEGLSQLGHDVTLIGSGDLFKKYPVDINIAPVFFRKKAPVFFRKLIHKITGFDIADVETYLKVKSILTDLQDYDVVQLINEDAFTMHPKMQISILKRIINQNKKLYLLCCGDDYITINHYLKEELKYSILTPYLKNRTLKKQFSYSLKYTTKSYKKLHEFIKKHSQGTIATDIDYHLPMLNHKQYLGLIPNPINTNKLYYAPLSIDGKIIIFHGINNMNYTKKGNAFFEEALNIIQKKYTNSVEIITTRSLPYSEYIKTYNKAHIILDQVYSYDQGYNALEAMSQGKVVFTGAEKEWLDYYHLKEDSVAINALPDATAIAKKLEWLILNPEKILEISKNARAFIEKEHDYITIAKKYLDIWQGNINN
ncbi:glycosyltransferase [Corallibacter sp.]|uniref:glycosyltransferase n=1 Tax=Corallibacter sp. TaxID=2038084 RepID=UPI003AB56946